jgi:hypothetical protein
VEIVEAVDESASPGVGEPGEQAELFQRLRIRALVVAGETLQNFVTPLLDANIPTGYSPVQNSIKIIPTSDQILESDGKVHWTVRAERSLMNSIPTHQLADSIRGATKSQAIDRLSIVAPGIQQAEIALMPGWWPRLPLLAIRIRLIAAGSQ